MARGRGRPKKPRSHRRLREEVNKAKRHQKTSLGLPRVVCDAWLALVIVTREGHITAVDLADKLGIGMNNMRLILKRLAAYGLVKGHNYKGYALHRRSSSITMCDVATAMCEERMGKPLVSRTSMYPWFVNYYSDVCEYAWKAYAGVLSSVVLSQCLRDAPIDIHSEGCDEEWD